MDQQSPTLQRINTVAGQLRRGDILRDVGINRIVAKVEPVSALVSDIVIHFAYDPAHPDAPGHLSVGAAQPVTAWRAT